MEVSSEIERQSSSSARPQNRMLNVFRSLAALAVVLGHVRLLFFADYSNAQHSPLNAILYAFTSLGSQAVIVFFVLSGYWVGGSVISRFRSRNFTWSEYANARLTRLWLVLIPALALTILLDRLGIALFPNADVYAQTSAYEGLPETLSYSPLTFLGNLAFLQDLHVPVIGSNQPLWSLAFEFWYYLLFPSLLAIFCRGDLKSRLFGLLLTAIAAVVAGPAVLILFPVWAFGAGIAALHRPLARFLLALPQGTLSAIRIAAVLLILGASVASHEIELPFSLGSLLLGAITALGVAVFVVDVPWAGVPGRILDGASWTAHSSYSLYATHMPVVTLLAAIVVPNFERRWNISLASSASFLGVVVVCCAIAYFFARFTERRTDKVRAWTKPLFQRGRAELPAPARMTD